MHFSVPCTVADIVADILSTHGLLTAGWAFHLAYDGGPSVEVPSVGTFPLRVEGHTIQLDLVPAVSLGCPHGSFTVYRPNDASHAGLPVVSFLLDSGATETILRPRLQHLLQRLGSFPGVRVQGVNGDTVRPLAAGFLDIAFPGTGAAVRPSTPGGVYLAIPPLASAFSTVPDSSRPSAGPIIGQASALAERFNVFDHDSLRHAHEHMAGVLPIKVAARMDYSGGMSQYALHRRPAIRNTVNTITASIREASLPGTVWWTDISHKYEPDFDGNHYGRTFAEEHTSYALEYFSVDKSSASLIRHLERLKSWVIQHVPGSRVRVIRCDFGSCLLYTSDAADE